MCVKEEIQVAVGKAVPFSEQVSVIIKKIHKKSKFKTFLKTSKTCISLIAVCHNLIILHTTMRKQKW
jgi:hypothetical protein